MDLITIYGGTVILPVAASIVSVVIGIFLKKYFDKTMDKIIKKRELVLNTQFDTLKEKTKLYWLIYFKLLRCLSTKMLIDKLNDDDSLNIITLESDIIIPTMEDVINLINNNIHIMDVDDEFLELILRLTSHVITYKCLKNLHINKKPSEYGFPYPSDFTIEIKKRALFVQDKYDEFIENQKKSTIIKFINNINDNFENNLKNDIIELPQSLISDANIETHQLNDLINSPNLIKIITSKPIT